MSTQYVVNNIGQLTTQPLGHNFLCPCIRSQLIHKIRTTAYFVTFDQPLYEQAVNMVVSSASNSELSSVVVRLSGFHLLVSFMGVAGYIMGGGGLK